MNWIEKTIVIIFISSFGVFVMSGLVMIWQPHEIASKILWSTILLMTSCFILAHCIKEDRVNDIN
jgi:hypothetical protein